MWQKVFTETGTPETWSADHFFRQDVIPVLHIDNEIIAAHFYTFFHLDLDVTNDHEYFSIYTKEAMQTLRNHPAKTLMSMEFLSVNPEWRKSKVDFSIGELMINLGLNVMKSFQADVALGVARKVVKVDKMAINTGFSLIAEDIKRGNLVCDLYAFYKDSAPPAMNDEQSELLSLLWSKKQVTEQKANRFAAA